jgi:glycerol-3-phosphate dehydrogenase (NAD(P)+)
MTAGKNILVLGYGEMGHAMECLLGSRHVLQFWDIRPLENQEPVRLEEAAASAEFVLYCVPVTPLAELAERVLPCLSAGSISLSIAKGLDEAGRPAPHILADVYAAHRDYGVLYGPMISEEIRDGRPAYAQLAVSAPVCMAPVQQLFAGTGLALEPTNDMDGIAWSSVLKNVYAMLFGVADGLQLGDNVRGYLVVQALQEMQEIVTGRGGQPGTARQLAGLGDLVTTATSAGSHHHALGRQLAHGAGGLAGEGVHTLRMLRKFDLLQGVDCPLVDLGQRLVEQPARARELLREWLPGA